MTGRRLALPRFVPRLVPALVLLAAALALTCGTVRAESLVSALSADVVRIESNYTGTNIVVFGEIARDAGTVGRPDAYDIAVIVSGPETDVTTRRKGRFLGIWVNRDSEVFADVPSFLAVHTTRPAHELAPRPLLEEHRIGLRYLHLRIARASDVPIGDRSNFRAAFLRLRLASGLYAERHGVIDFLSDSLFRTTVPLPANIPVGDYKVSVYLLQGGALLAEEELPLRVAKTGFEQHTHWFAHQYSAAYGLLAVLLAVFTGWLAGVIFRRD